MNHSMINAFVSMQALQQKLDVLAHNIANVNTTGYKRRDASFQDILTNVSNQPATFERNGRLTPLGLPQGWGAKIGQVEINLEQGALNLTGNPFDIGIEGNGLFEVQTDSVDDAGNPKVAWTRDGSFKLTPTGDNPDEMFLTTSEGYRVLNANNQPIRIPLNYEIVVREDGAISARNSAAPESTPVEIGRLKLVRAIYPQVLINEGNNLFGMPPGVTADQVLETVTAANNNINESTRVAVRQGFAEQSNVNLTEEMTELMTLQRAYQMNARAITSSDTLMSLANNLRA
ncbi:flagellar hook-basal body protein [Paenibacillus thermotolerans]|uniref:flagellar hook-basal body protein n=1 Tax=Paenibacillus thermotolerans TaxID=3027807 RepID=UPI0023687ECC|nr:MULTISPECIES: flagellar hook-basal body protein [unclassified Paenibacillus]